MSPQNPTTLNKTSNYVSNTDVTSFHARKEEARVKDCSAIQNHKLTAEEIQNKNSLFSEASIQKSTIISYPSF